MYFGSKQHCLPREDSQHVNSVSLGRQEVVIQLPSKHKPLFHTQYCRWDANMAALLFEGTHSAATPKVIVFIVLPWFNSWDVVPSVSKILNCKQPCILAQPVACIACWEFYFIGGCYDLPLKHINKHGEIVLPWIILSLAKTVSANYIFYHLQIYRINNIVLIKCETICLKVCTVSLELLWQATVHFNHQE